MKQDDRLRAQQAKRSLDDINRSVQVPGVYETSFSKSFWLIAVPVRW